MAITFSRDAGNISILRGSWRLSPWRFQSVLGQYIRFVFVLFLVLVHSQWRDNCNHRICHRNHCGYYCNMYEFMGIPHLAEWLIVILNRSITVHISQCGFVVFVSSWSHEIKKRASRSFLGQCRRKLTWENSRCGIHTHTHTLCIAHKQRTVLGTAAYHFVSACGARYSSSAGLWFTIFPVANA